jgi:glycosyltransferase involved in cell wall biosynthesis
MKSAVIVFTDEWLPYAPSVLNLLTCLKEKGYRVRVATIQSEAFRNFEAYENDVDSIRVPGMIRRVLVRRHWAYQFVKALLFAMFHGRAILRADICFCVDSLAFTVSRLFRREAYYVSLEAVRDRWFFLARRLGISHVLIQTPERFDFLFEDAVEAPACWILPNAPLRDPNFAPPDAKPHDLVYLGLVSPSHGVESCIEALASLPDFYRLTVRGPSPSGFLQLAAVKYESTVNTGRLTLDPTYLAQEDVLPYLSQFGAGFCFYDFDILARNDFNYVSCPSGKLYNYLAAGVPVIGSDILGLRPVRENDCGVLLTKPTPKAIADAVQALAADQEGYRSRCLSAATQFDFRAHFDQFFSAVIERKSLHRGVSFAHA